MIVTFEEIKWHEDETMKHEIERRFYTNGKLLAVFFIDEINEINKISPNVDVEVMSDYLQRSLVDQKNLEKIEMAQSLRDAAKRAIETYENKDK